LCKNNVRILSSRAFATGQQPFKIDDKFDDYEDITLSEELFDKKALEPPIEITGKPGDYASQLFTAASMLDALDAVENDFNWLLEASKNAPLFQQFLLSGLPDKSTTRKLLQGVLKGANLHRLTQAFLVTKLLMTNELKFLPDVAAAYIQLMKAHRKEVKVAFTFASLPDKDFLSRQIERVKKYRLEPDATPNWEFKINPDLIGGFVLEIGTNFTANFAVSYIFHLMQMQFRQVEDKWERVKPQGLNLESVDTSKVLAALQNTQVSADDPLQFLKNLKEKEAIESFDFEKLKTAKHLDLAQYEKSLLQKIPENDEAAKQSVKDKIRELKLLQKFDTSLLGVLTKKYNPDAYQKYQDIFAHA